MLCPKSNDENGSFFQWQFAYLNLYGVCQCIDDISDLQVGLTLKQTNVHKYMIAALATKSKNNEFPPHERAHIRRTHRPDDLYSNPFSVSFIKFDYIRKVYQLYASTCKCASVFRSL